MMSINFAVVKFAFFLAAGITSAFLFPCSFLVLKILPVCLALLLATKWIEGKKLILGNYFGALTYLTFFILGYASYQLRLPKFQQKHYSHFLKEGSAELIQLKIVEVLKPSSYHHKFVGQLFQLNQQKVNGNVLINLKKDSLGNKHFVDEVLLVSSEILEIPNPSNPHQFNYKQYLQHLGIYHQLQISKDHILKQFEGSLTLRGFSEKWRTNIITQLENTSVQKEQRAILQALVLGQRSGINKEMREQYAAAGVLHILAVSGLHVGVLFLIFGKILTPLQQMKHGKVIQSLCLIVLLWCFAVFTGWSPSVVRAVTMFSCFSIAGLLNRLTSTYNNLFLSFFILLLFQPAWLFQVGFQLSYLAVFSIIWIQPKLYSLYRPYHFFDKTLWSIFTVTIAAQLGVAPLSIYYFNQFPSLFVLSNIVILPFLSVLLIGGIVVVTLSFFNLLPQFMAQGYNWLISQLNNFIGWVASQESFLFKDLSISVFTMICCYLFMGLFILWLIKKKTKFFTYSLVALSLLLGSCIWADKFINQQQLIVFHKTRSTILGHQQGRNLTLFQDDSLIDYHSYPIKDYRMGSNNKNVVNNTIPTAFNYKNQTFLVIDSLGVYPSRHIDVVLLTQSSKIHLGQLIDMVTPDLIIADGSNYNSYINRWKSTCEKRTIKFHSTHKKGAYIFE